MSAETGSAEAAKRPGPCFLIKLARGHGLASASTHELRGVPFSVRPLFGSAVGLDEFGAAAEGGWVVAEPMVGGAIAAAAGLDTAPQWQLAHEMYDRMAGGAEIVEPDLLQDGAALATRRKGPDDGTPFAGAPEESCSTAGPWHLDPDFSDLARARGRVPHPDQGKVRIVQLDTGYDPRHEIFQDVTIDKARNFHDTSNPNGLPGAEEPDTGVISEGHGTGTLGILAGKKLAAASGTVLPANTLLGGIPGATVTPVRVADFVAQFYTSSMAAGLRYALAVKADLVTISLGGLPSHAWAEAVDALYEKGIVVVAAAGNNFNGLPYRPIVWPARYDRVIAACGIMHSGKPYVKRQGWLMEGNYGPPSAMRTAMSSYTPCIAWPRIRTGNTVERGGGTSSATPQIAATAALYIAANKARLDALGGWKKVEAVRAALFGAAAPPSPENKKFLGRGVLKADAVLDREVKTIGLVKEKAAAREWFELLGALQGMAPSSDGKLRMLMLEATHVALQSKQIAEKVRANDAATLDIRELAADLLEEPGLSHELRDRLEKTREQGKAPEATPPEDLHEQAQTENWVTTTPVPATRKLRIFTTDPLAALHSDSADVATATIEVPWEPRASPGDGEKLPELPAGPVGEYVEVIDVDPAGNRWYPPVRLSDERLAAQNGVTPSVSDARFHQQMVYAVAMRTIDKFEQALGRRILWAERPDYWKEPEFKQLKKAIQSAKDKPDPRALQDRCEYGFVRRLRIYPHALRAKNAYYSPAKVALLFGYFYGLRRVPGAVRQGDVVFTCLSFDIIAHETTHAVLDGLNRRLREACNDDVLAFHEAFADIVALFQRFSMAEFLRREIRKNRGRLEESDLGALAKEFGQALGYGKALRDAINSDPKTNNYFTATEPHDRGAVLVAAVFDAFLTIYRTRIDRLLSVIPLPSAGRPIHPDLVELLANEARKAADHVLTMCIRAIDYLPPVNVRFAEFLRALITVDSDLEPEDPLHYRTAFIEAFRRRHIYPDSLAAMSVELLRWRKPAGRVVEGLADLVRSLRLPWGRQIDRLDLFASSRSAAIIVHDWLTKNPRWQRLFGIDLSEEAKLPPCCSTGEVEVASVRTIERITPGGRISREIAIVLTQKWRPLIDETGPSDESNRITIRTGTTIIVGAEDSISNDDDRIRYIIKSSALRSDDDSKIMAARAFRAREPETNLYFSRDSRSDSEPFAMLHNH